MRQNFTDEEWSVLMQAPMQAIAAITLADKADPVTFLKEVQASIRMLEEELKKIDISSDVAQSLVKQLNQMDIQDPLQGEQLALKKQFELLGYIQSFDSPKDVRKAAVAHFERVATIISSKVTGDQGVGFKHWLMSVATKAAETIKEGGVFGIGASRISEREADVLKDLSKALGLEG